MELLKRLGNWLSSLVIPLTSLRDENKTLKTLYKDAVERGDVVFERVQVLGARITDCESEKLALSKKLSHLEADYSRRSTGSALNRVLEATSDHPAVYKTESGRLVAGKTKLTVEDLTRAAAARIKAEDISRDAVYRANSAEAEASKAREDHINSLKKVANYEAIRSGAPVVPYPEVYTPPARPDAADDNGTEFTSSDPRRMQMAAVAKSRRHAAELRQKVRDDIQNIS